MMIHTAPPSLRTPRLSLRFLQSEDVRPIFSLLEDADVRYGTSHWPEQIDIAHVRNWLGKMREQKEAGLSLVYAICDHIA